MFILYNNTLSTNSIPATSTTRENQGRLMMVFFDILKLLTEPLLIERRVFFAKAEHVSILLRENTSN